MIKQRFLYVGIGGSGLDIGRELADALTREICGLDGRRLVERGGPFAGFVPNQLPSFVQSVYLDFSAAALDEINTHLQGKNAVAATNILPPFPSSAAAAQFLRANAVPGVNDWIPVEDGVNVSPLSSGAGQYPNVGRTALFASLCRSGYQQTLGSHLGGAVSRLAQSMGELASYAGQDTHTSNIAVYVGFSLSGGTGCGIFYDVIHFIYDELTTKLPEVNCTIMPIVLLPSLFEEVLVGNLKRNTNLNAATALLDLSRLMDLFNSPDPVVANERKVIYPWVSSNGTFQPKSINLDAQFGKTSVKVATLVGKTGGLKRRDVYRSIASSVVAQISTVSEVEQQVMGFLDKLVNDNDIRDFHHSLLGRKNVMPTVSASLTLPAERLTEVISQRLLGLGLRAQELTSEHYAINVDDEKELLRGTGQSDLVDARTFESEAGLQIRFPASTTTKQVFEDAKIKLDNQIRQALPLIESRIGSRVFEISNFKTYEGLIKSLNSSDHRNLAEALRIGNASANRLSGGSGWDAGAPPRIKKKKSGVADLIKRKVEASEVAKARGAKEAEFQATVATIWWRQWSEGRPQWETSVQTGVRTMREISGYLAQMSRDADESFNRELGKLRQPTLGVVEFLPTETGDVEVALENLISQVRSLLRRQLNLNQEDDGSLLSAMMRHGETNVWVEALKRLESTGSYQVFFDTLLNPIRRLVQGQLAEVLPSLASLLSDLSSTNGQALSPQIDQLRAVMAGLLPDGVIPSAQAGKPRVLVTYPGNRSGQIESTIRRVVFGDRYGDLQDHSVFQFAAVPDGNSLTATVNVVGQGLLDSPEVRSVFELWQSAVSNPAPTDRLLWRQRVGFRDLGSLTDKVSRKRILSRFLGALYDGQVELVEGDLKAPQVLRIWKAGTQISMDISLKSLYGASPWAYFFNGFEEAIVSSGSLWNPDLPEVVRWFGTFVPSGLLSPESSGPDAGKMAKSPSALFEDFVNVMWQEVARGEEDVPVGIAGPAKDHIGKVVNFWRSEVPEALLAEYYELNVTYWCIGGAYVHSGNDHRLREVMAARVKDLDPIIQQRRSAEAARRQKATAWSE